ncbi:PREDICTED: activated CDC42 kinase 1-like [Xyrichtys novacula]|uniref:PREDICTED: activated CDC42 kinase 1-like n=1 Tax=Xyrichtys novacula TaxID=13765 RepID=A0AAV1HAJ5_XYRNO|nr:PREDICTED: activated CDC42 kinase 1-like [Xyrichtys novacula]
MDSPEVLGKDSELFYDSVMDDHDDEDDTSASSGLKRRGVSLGPKLRPWVSLIDFNDDSLSSTTPSPFTLSRAPDEDTLKAFIDRSIRLLPPTPPPPSSPAFRTDLRSPPRSPVPPMRPSKHNFSTCSESPQSRSISLDDPEDTPSQIPPRDHVFSQPGPRSRTWCPTALQSHNWSVPQAINHLKEMTAEGQTEP